MVASKCPALLILAEPQGASNPLLASLARAADVSAPELELQFMGLCEELRRGAGNMAAEAELRRAGRALRALRAEAEALAATLGEPAAFSAEQAGEADGAPASGTVRLEAGVGAFLRAQQRQRSATGAPDAGAAAGAPLQPEEMLGLVRDFLALFCTAARDASAAGSANTGVLLE